MINRDDMVPVAMLLLLMPAVIVGFVTAGYWLSIIFQARYISDQRHQEVCEHVKRVYRNVSGFNLNDEESEAVRARGGCPIYGEIVPDSMRILAEKIQLSSQDVFYDLGSGVGKFPIYMHLATPVKKSVGIELAPSRHRSAQGALDRLKSKGVIKADTERQISFIHGDMTEVDLSDATFVFLCATCFSSELMEKLMECFMALKPGLRIATLKRLPEHPRFLLTDSLALRTTWSDGSPIYCYKLAE
ncbi:MAG: hypothetical protein AAFP93_01020 [Bacteroidota bacterium]